MAAWVQAERYNMATITIVTANNDSMKLFYSLVNELIALDFAFTVDYKNTFGLPTPYLVVDGVPLDHDRAIRWIKECGL